LRLLVFGFGSIGRRHVESGLGLGHEVALCRRRRAGDEDVPVFTSLADAQEWRADAVVVATPTALHLESLRWAVEHSVHAYVEKPLAASTDGVAGVLAEAERRGLVIAVGYNLRFHPALETIRGAILEGRIGRLESVRAEVGSYLPDWHPDEDYRTSYAARRDLGGGALLTLSHELDYVRWIAGEVEAVDGIATRVGSLELDVDDVAELTCRHLDGAVSSVHQDLLDRAYNRRSRWVGETGSIEWPWDGPVRLLPADELLWSDPGYDVVRTYEAALADFIAVVESGGSPRATGRDGLRIVELCEEVLS
jgi:predicted dehydrogenase